MTSLPTVARVSRTAIAAAALALAGCDGGTPTAAGDALVPSAAEDAGTEAGPDGASPSGFDPNAPTERVPLPPRLVPLVAGLDRSMYQCPDRVWPGIIERYRTKSQLLLVSAPTSFLWNDLAAGVSPGWPRISSVPTASLGPEWSTLYNSDPFRGFATLGVQVPLLRNKTPIPPPPSPWSDFELTLVFHEAFHALSGQNDWAGPAGSRAIGYPESWEPRFLRASIISGLLAQARGQPGGDLPAVAFWHSRFAAEWKADRELIRSTDIDEGTAEYAQVAMTALAELGCDAGETAVDATLVSHLDSEGFLRSFDGEVEAYHLGVLSGLLLRRARRPGWELAVQGGQTPVDVLLEGVTPVIRPDDVDLRTRVKGSVDARNARTKALVDPMLKRLHDPATYRIAISQSWGSGSFSTAGFITLRDEPGTPEVTLAYDGAFDLPGKTSRITVRGLSLVELPTTPCAKIGSPIVATVAKEDLMPGGAAGRFNAKSGPVTFTELPAEIVTSREGPWLCPTVTTNAAAAPRPRRRTDLLRRVDSAARARRESILGV